MRFSASSKFDPNVRGREAGRQGSVLIIVLWVAFGLVSLALYFANSMSLELRAADNRAASLEAEQAIEGAGRYVTYLLSNLEEPGKAPDLQIYPREAVPVGEARFWILGRTNFQTTPSEPYFSLVEEASKLNLNTASREMLEALPRMTPELAAAIVDWRDADSDVTSNGAENETYLRLNPPYRCKNARFESIDELRLVLGADLEILYGEDLNLNGVLDPNENDGNTAPPVDNRDGRLDPGILEYVTIYSREPNTNTTSGQMVEGRINVNTASEQVLACLPGIGPDKAPELVAYRLANPDKLTSTAWVAEVLEGPATAQVRPLLTVQSFQFTADVAAVGHHGRGYRRTRFVFDAVEGTPQILHRQDLSQLGWALGRNARQMQLLARNTR